MHPSLARVSGVRTETRDSPAYARHGSLTRRVALPSPQGTGRSLAGSPFPPPPGRRAAQPVLHRDPHLLHEQGPPPAHWPPHVLPTCPLTSWRAISPPPLPSSVPGSLHPSLVLTPRFPRTCTRYAPAGPPYAGGAPTPFPRVAVRLSLRRAACRCGRRTQLCHQIAHHPRHIAPYGRRSPTSLEACLNERVHASMTGSLPQEPAHASMTRLMPQ